MTHDFGKMVRFIILLPLHSLMFARSLNANPNLPHGHFLTSYTNPAVLEFPGRYRCFLNNKWGVCPQVTNYLTMRDLDRKSQIVYPTNFYNNILGMVQATTPLQYNVQSMLRPLYSPYNANVPGIADLLPLEGLWPTKTRKSYSSIDPSLFSSTTNTNTNNIANLNYKRTSEVSTSQQNSSIVSNATTENDRTTKYPPTTKALELLKNATSREEFIRGLDRFGRNFYMITFKKLLSISPEGRKENGMSFVQSGLLLYLTLMALSVETDEQTGLEIENCIGYRHSEAEKIDLIDQIMTSLPISSDELKFRRSSRLVLDSGSAVRDELRAGDAKVLGLHVVTINATQDPSEIANNLNHMVDVDSGGAIHNTFDGSELSQSISAILLTTVYFRARWRSAPTVLNGTRAFRDLEDAPERNMRMIRINDVMRYADLTEWDAEALEIHYAKPGLSFLMLIPRGRSLKNLTELVANAISLDDIINRMKTVRVAATLPLYTLRMTLLLPNKLQAMGLSRLVNTTEANETLRLSHAVQRLMFWAEAGRNAYKDDGIEWDEPPKMEVVVDRPYIFFVRWHNLTLMNGNFVL